MVATLAEVPGRPESVLRTGKRVVIEPRYSSPCYTLQVHLSTRLWSSMPNLVLYVGEKFEMFPIPDLVTPEMKRIELSKCRDLARLSGPSSRANLCATLWITDRPVGAAASMRSNILSTIERQQNGKHGNAMFVRSLCKLHHRAES
jgi:hypothetical protein